MSFPNPPRRSPDSGNGEEDRLAKLERISRTTVDEVIGIKSDVGKIAGDLKAMRSEMRGIVNGGLVKGTAASGSIFLLVDMIGKQLEKAPPLAITIVLSLLAVSVPLGVIAAIMIRRHHRLHSEPPPSDDLDLQ